MAVQVYSFAVVIPTGVAVAAPQITELTMPARVVREIDVRVPPGPRGEVGFRIGSAGVAVLPVNPSSWVVTDDEEIAWPLAGQHDSGAWQCFAYNTGAYAHTLWVRFQVDLVAAATAASAPIPLAVLQPPAVAA